MKSGFTTTLQILFFMVITIVTRAQPIERLQVADSLFISKLWASAKIEYQNYLIKDTHNSIIWNKLGFCNQNLNLNQEAIQNYKMSLANNPSPPVKSIVMFRMSMIYSNLNKTDTAADYLIKATSLGYNSLKDLDSINAFKNLRASSKFKELRKNIFEMVYPCSKEPRNRDFDFWIGDWTCYRTGSQILSGYSHVESIAGGCALLENYTSTQAYDGKSFNFYDTITGKWEQDWIGAGGPGDRQRYYNGVFKEGKMHFIYETNNANGGKVKGNFIFYFINQDSVRQYQDLMDSTGKTISITYDLTYRRKK
jgi:tetratricopeptide (TPR) repeat protein